MSRSSLFRLRLVTATALATLLTAGASSLPDVRAYAETVAMSPADSGFGPSLEAARAVVAACAAAASGCNPGALPVDAQVHAPDGRSFRASWLWLREAVAKAKGSSARERTDAMRDAREHLDEMAAEAGSGQTALRAAEFSRAKPAAASILARGEFQADAGPSSLDRAIARLQDWFLRLLLGMDRVGTHNPWIAPFAEWTCFLLAAGGLLFFVRRNLARQALRIAIGEAAVRNQLHGGDATEWARLAAERGAAGDWREGVHCLYWAAIHSLEARRVWRPNPTRTPREYVRLMPPGSEAQRELRALTRRFEAVWYGHETATEIDFRAAEIGFEAIRSAQVDRNGMEGRHRGAGTAVVGAA